MEAIGHEGNGERPLLSFQVITDTHVTADPQHVHNRNLERALRDIAENAADSCGIMHVGDVTDHGFPEEYEELKRIWRQYGDRLPDARFATGNHDIALGKWEARLGRFLEATGMAGPYHDHRIEGHLFLFLGTEKGLELYCSLSEEQLKWLDAKLGEETGTGRPAFVFLHQPLKDTVAGSRESQGWHGVEQDEELRGVLARHPHAILFTGHTHWELGTPYAFYNGESRLPAMFNAASVGYLWTDDDEHKDGSQGYYVEVYPDRVQVRGRDFEQGTWIEGVLFEVRPGKRRG